MKYETTAKLRQYAAAIVGKNLLDYSFEMMLQNPLVMDEWSDKQLIVIDRR